MAVKWCWIGSEADVESKRNWRKKSGYFRGIMEHLPSFMCENILRSGWARQYG